MQWDSPWGKGFPGWHIECSAMAMKYSGETLDIHTGGEDNVFPHHESEIAQSEAATGQPFVNYWFHTRHLLVDNQKMSKSLGNFYTVRDILNKGYAPGVLRYTLLNTHYRQSLNFTLESLDAARSAVQRLLDFKHKLVDIIAKVKSDNLEVTSPLGVLKEAQARFESAMNDDLNISEALAAVFDMVREVNKLELSGSTAGIILRLLERFDTVLGILSEEEAILDKDVEQLIEERQTARANKQYQKADEIRQKLSKTGIILEDTPQGVRWKRKI
jgi:cysteinyl-tRNA synthetase